MPIYEFQCQNKNCNAVTECVRKVGDTEPIKCPKCDSKTVKIFSKTSPPKFVGVGFTPKFFPR